jgi:hypothetical protein
VARRRESAGVKPTPSYGTAPHSKRALLPLAAVTVDVLPSLHQAGKPSDDIRADWICFF